MDEVVAPLLHNKEPVKDVAVNIELPQLFTTVTTGTDGIAFGAATPLPEGLVQPFTVWVTVYVPAVVTVMDEVVAPLLHNKEPVKDVAVNIELPQLFTTVTTGADGIAFGAATPLPEGLVQPFTVWVTEYVPAVVTVMDEVVAPLLHNKEPVNDVAVNIELPQLSTTDTVGAAGIAFGAATPLPEGLVQPFNVCVTEYVPAVVTVIEDEVIASVLHNKEPVKDVAVNIELPQLFTTVTTGADGIACGAATPLPEGLVQPFNVCVTVYVPAIVTVIDEVVAPLLHNKEPV
jgi:hypothetical protein